MSTNVEVTSNSSVKMYYPIVSLNDEDAETSLNLQAFSGDKIFMSETVKGRRIREIGLLSW